MKRVLCAIALVCMLVTALAAQTPLANLAGSMTSGSWAELTTTNSSVLNQPGTDGNIIGYAADAAWNPIARKLCYIGNDHIDGDTAQALRFVCYDEATNAWQNMPAPPFSQPGSTNHGYYHHAVNPANGDIYRRQFKESGIIYRYRNGAWSQSPALTMETSYACCGSLEYVPELGGAVLVQGGENGGGSVYLFTESTQAWSKLADNIAPLTGSTFTAGAYSSVAKILVFGQNGNFYKLDANRVVTRIANPPITFYDGQGWLGNLVADPVSGKFLALSATDRQFHVYDPAANVWQAQSSTSKPNLANLSIISAPISNYGVTAYVACQITNCRTYLYKYAASTAPPPAPTPEPSPTPPPITSFPITINAVEFAARVGGTTLVYPSGGTGLKLWENGYIEHPLDYVTGRYRFTIRAEGNLAGSELPNMEVRIDQNRIGNVGVGTTTANYTFEADLTAGTHRVQIAYTNDFWQAPVTGDRNLIVWSMTVAAVGTTTPPPPPPPSGTLPLGPLTHDGPPTPEQLALFLPVTGSLPQTATAMVRYKAASSTAWIVSHPLFRVQPGFSEIPALGSVIDAFAWPIIDLQPGTAYNVEVTVTSGTTTEVKTATFTTRALPPAAGSANKTIAAGSSATNIQATLDALNPGDVLQFATGSYTAGLILRRSGTQTSPIFIRGASRSGTILSGSRVFQIQNASDVILENFTAQGPGVDSGTNASSVGIEFFDGTPNQTRVTVRNITFNGFDRGVSQYAGISQTLVYDNTFVGNNPWTSAFIDSNLTWNDDGINLGGTGNAAFNNTLKGFGDCLAFAAHAGGQATSPSLGVHFYRNELRNCGDDMAEADHGIRNVTSYDNRSHNSMTFLSLDPLYGGPLVAARNIIINTGRTPFKWNSTNSGQFIYNNTIVRTTGKYWLDGFTTSEAGWYQPNNGDQRAYGFQNNLMVYRGVGGQTIRLDNSGHTPVDFSHNSWFPDAVFQWPQGRYSNLAAAYGGLSATVPVFSGFTKRHERDSIVTSNPWTDTITLGANYRTEVTATYTPMLAAGTAKNSGVVVPGITDGFSGAAPDRGALISGRSLPVYGDRGGSAPPPPPPPPEPTPMPTISGTIRATGTLTINGISTPVTVDVTVQGQ